MRTCISLNHIHVLSQCSVVEHLTFSLLDGGGLVGGASVCTAFDTVQTLPTASGTGLSELSINAPSFLGLASATRSTEEEETTEGNLEVWMY